MKGSEELEPFGEYACHWDRYANVAPGPGGEFRFLALVEVRP